MTGVFGFRPLLSLASHLFALHARRPKPSHLPGSCCMMRLRGAVELAASSSAAGGRAAGIFAAVLACQGLAG